MLDFLQPIMPNVFELWTEVVKETYATFYMLTIVGIFSLLLGSLCGVITVVTRKGGLLENRYVFFVLDKFINFFRAIPFIIMLMMISPLTKLIMGTSIGTNGSLFPLIVGTVPFFARQVESSLMEVDQGLIEASQSMGASPFEIIFRVYLKESIPGIIRGTTITLISLIGLIAMVGAVGGGGLGSLAINYGFYANKADVMYTCVIFLLVITTLIQMAGDYLVRKTTH